MAKVERLQEVVKKLSDRGQDAKESNVSVVVGYTTAYAVYVHEDLEAKHPVGQAKYLEQPARELAKTLGDAVKVELRQGMKLKSALLRAGLRLQRASMALVPVDTGVLRASAFTRADETPVG